MKTEYEQVGGEEVTIFHSDPSRKDSDILDIGCCPILSYFQGFSGSELTVKFL